MSAWNLDGEMFSLVLKDEILTHHWVELFRAKYGNGLDGVDSLELNNCEVHGEFFELFLQYFPFIRKLVISTETQSGALCGTSNAWLNNHFECIEHLGLRVWDEQIEELNSFFELNPTIQTFSINDKCLSRNWVQLMRMGGRCTLGCKTLIVEFDDIDEDDCSCKTKEKESNDGNMLLALKWNGFCENYIKKVI